jgi:hypothetical protein
MLSRVDLVRADVSEEFGASIIRVTRIGELGTTLPVTSNRRTLRRNSTSVLIRATRCNIPDDAILLSRTTFFWVKVTWSSCQEGYACHWLWLSNMNSTMLTPTWMMNRTIRSMKQAGSDPICCVIHELLTYHVTNWETLPRFRRLVFQLKLWDGNSVGMEMIVASCVFLEESLRSKIVVSTSSRNE